jgi:hypothetical protein
MPGVSDRGLRILLSAAALLAGACGEGAPAAAESAAAPPAVAAPAAEPATGLFGTWFLLMPELPFAALRLDVRDVDGQPQASWIAFDPSVSAGADDLAARSKPVAVSLAGDLSSLVITGPAPMLTEGNQPNGQRGSWRFDLTAPPDGAPRLAGVAVHPDLTSPLGTAAVMTREFRGTGGA